jgi:hypothetical protein
MRDIIRLRTAARRCREIAGAGRGDAALYSALALEIDGKLALRQAALAALRARRHAPAPQPQRLAA